MKNGSAKQAGNGKNRRSEDQFPILIRVGGTVIKILYNPLTIPPRKGSEATSDPEAQPRKYDSYLVEYWFGSQIVRKRCSTLEKAHAVADEVRDRIRNQDIESVSLLIQGRDRRIYLAAMDRLAGLGKELDEAAKEYSDAVRALAAVNLNLPLAIQQAIEIHQRLNGVPIGTILDFYDRHGRRVVDSKTVPEIAEELVAALKADQKGDYHVRDLALRLGRFTKAFPGKIADVTTKQINEWLRSLRSESQHLKRDGVTKDIAGKTRNHYRNSVVQLFNFARDNGYLPKDLTTAAQDAQRAKENTAENQIFVPNDMTQLLMSAPGYTIPSMVIKAFSGVRTEEIFKLEWEMIRFDQDCIVLPARITKLTQRRTIVLKPNLKAWLQPFRGCTGRICRQWRTPGGIFQAWQRHAIKQDIHIGRNKFRNSFISFRLAETRDIQRVALESGNSPAVIQRDYLELAPPEDAAKWFAIMPTADKLAELQTLADELLEAQRLRDGDLQK